MDLVSPTEYISADSDAMSRGSSPSTGLSRGESGRRSRWPRTSMSAASENIASCSCAAVATTVTSAAGAAGCGAGARCRAGGEGGGGGGRRAGGG